MPDTFTINLNQPVTSVKMLTAEDSQRAAQEFRFNSANSADSTVKIMQDLEKQKAETAQLYRVLSSLVDELSKFYDGLLASHKEEIAKLSVEIARKILMQKVQKGDYQIEAIVKEALKNAPVRQGVVVHLNPADLTGLGKLAGWHVGRAGKDDSGDALADVKFIADSNIGPAECLVETPKGIIKSLIDEHLQRIREALEKAK